MTCIYLAICTTARSCREDIYISTEKGIGLARGGNI